MGSRYAKGGAERPRIKISIFSIIIFVHRYNNYTYQYIHMHIVLHIYTKFNNAHAHTTYVREGVIYAVYRSDSSSGSLNSIDRLPSRELVSPRFITRFNSVDPTE